MKVICEGCGEIYDVSGGPDSVAMYIKSAHLQDDCPDSTFRVYHD